MIQNLDWQIRSFGKLQTKLQINNCFDRQADECWPLSILIRIGSRNGSRPSLISDKLIRQELSFWYWLHDYHIHSHKNRSSMRIYAEMCPVWRKCFRFFFCLFLLSTSSTHFHPLLSIGHRFSALFVFGLVPVISSPFLPP